ncbi:MAG: hypothetical protein DCC59_06650 [Chloroflexi bacterium]|nr:hypothetical protein [Chloroflexi bacterium CFX1]MCK6568269.1 hypothetical protein [Anaerolineales bacterium]MCQ3953069.1 hypothetical protein [Chloroflexota bacterium]MDL1919114.1 hypothetical protein [Chloroflexi bacterium CFX5]NUQ59542.1 hypothetical protein [Anaerolineales bacterium]
MNTVLYFALQIVLTIVIVGLIVGYLRPFLKRILVDLCGAEERAQFWTAFSNILLFGLPLLFSLNFHPAAENNEELIFEIAGKISGNLGALLFALIGVGVFVSFFALFAPRTPKAEAK